MQQGSYHTLGPKGAETELTNTKLYMSHMKTKAPVGACTSEGLRQPQDVPPLRGRHGITTNTQACQQCKAEN